MERHPNDLTSDEAIDAAIAFAKHLDIEPRITEAVYYPEPGLEFLMLKLSDGRRMLIPREELSELSDATPEQASNLLIGPNGIDIWWPEIDDGLYLLDFLKYRWHNQNDSIAA